MSAHLSSIIMATAQLTQVLDFYKCLGVKFAEKKISLGTTYFWSQSNSVQFAFLEKKELRSLDQPQIHLSFAVSNVSLVLKELEKQNVICVLDPMEQNGQIRAIILDPDGRSVELCQSDK